MNKNLNLDWKEANPENEFEAAPVRECLERLEEFIDVIDNCAEGVKGA